MYLLYSSSDNPNMFYATGSFDGHDPFFYFESGGKKLAFLDSREFDVFKESCNTDVEIVLLDPYLEKAKFQALGLNGTEKLAVTLLDAFLPGDKLLQVPADFSLELSDFFRANGYTVEITDKISKSRRFKTQPEIMKIREASNKLEKAFIFVEGVLKNSEIKGDKIYYQGECLTSEWIKTEVEILLLREGMTFSSGGGIIFASGPRHASIPHHTGSGAVKPFQSLICDIFARDRKTGYFADITRTYFKGDTSYDVRQMYEAVRKVQAVQVEMVKPGVRNKDIHDAGCQMFIDLGYHVGKEGFAHGTGHGFGLEIHENPRLNNRTDEILEAGDVITIEPGLYYEKLGGVRIEDDVFVTGTGYENITTLSREFKIL